MTTLTQTPAEAADAAPPTTTTPSWQFRVVDWLSRYAASSTLVLVLLLAVFVTPNFFAVTNLRTVAMQAAILGVVVIGQTLTLLVRGLDMSVSAVISITAVLVVTTVDAGNVVLSVAIAVVIAAVVGLVNGLLITWRRVPPFVATFAMLIVVNGAQLAYTHGQTSGSAPDWLRGLGAGSLFGIPTAVVIWVVAVVVFGLLLKFTIWGRYVYTVGASPEAARHGGVPVNLVTISAYVICALLAALAGLLYAGYLGYIDQNFGVNMNLNSVAAAIIGGVTFTGGRGSVFGAAIGALLMTVLVNVVVVAGLPIYWQLIVQGLVLVLAVVIQGLRRRWMPDR